MTEEKKPTRRQLGWALAIQNLTRRAFLDAWTLGRRSNREVTETDWEHWLKQAEADDLMGKYLSEVGAKYGIDFGQGREGDAEE